MRSNGATLNAQLSRIISETGHTDLIVVADAGLPIPVGVERVDLAYRPGAPAFLDVLDTILAELAVESAALSEDIVEQSPEMFAAVQSRLDSRGISLELVPHLEFKSRTTMARAAVRTGEFTLFANIILRAGAAFGRHDDV